MRLKTLPFTALSPAHQAEIRQFHHEGVTWFFENAHTDADGMTTPATVCAVSDESLFFAWIQRDPRAARHMREVIMPLNIRGE